MSYGMKGGLEMTPIQIGIEVSAYAGAAMIVTAVIGAVCVFVKAQTMLLQAALVKNENPHGHLHPYTQSILRGDCPELKAAQRYLACGEKIEAEILVDEMCQLLEAENDEAMKTQLQTKLRSALRKTPRVGKEKHSQCKAIVASK